MMQLRNITERSSEPVRRSCVLKASSSDLLYLLSDEPQAC